MSSLRLKKPRDYWYRRKHMHYVTVPSPVVLRTIDKKAYRENDPDDPTKTIEMKPVTMHRYLMAYVVNEVHPPENQNSAAKAKIGSGYEGDKRIAKLDRLFENAKPGDVVAVEDEDWRKVRAIIEEKVWGLPTFGALLINFSDAWMTASDTKAVNGARFPESASLDPQV
jgi:hypothetical protein